jgi:hypothetical protein
MRVVGFEFTLERGVDIAIRTPYIAETLAQYAETVARVGGHFLDRIYGLVCNHIVVIALFILMQSQCITPVVITTQCFDY